jgi:U3 small nucleolar RNA-associated protein 12
VFLPDPTQTSAAHSRLLASVSKDSLLKVWDFDLQHCIETVAPGDGELWSLCAVHASQLPKTEQGSSSFVLVTGGSEGQIKMWDCAVSHKEEEMREDSQQQASSSNAQPNVIPLVRVHLQGTLAHTSTKRVAQLAFVPLENFAANDDSSPTSRQLAALTSDRTLQTFTFRSAHDIRKKIARRTKRAKEKGEGKPVNPVEPPKILTWTDQVESGEILRPSDGRFRSFTIADSRSNGAKEGKASHASLLFVLSTNALEVQRLSAKGKAKDTDGVQPVSGPVYSLDLAGHRNEIRALGFSNSGELVASACSSGLVKVWNLAIGSCLRTMPGFTMTHTSSWAARMAPSTLTMSPAATKSIPLPLTTGQSGPSPSGRMAMALSAEVPTRLLNFGTSQMKLKMAVRTRILVSVKHQQQEGQFDWRSSTFELSK